MALLRRKKAPTPPQKGLDIVRLALRGLVAQRVARRAFKGYRLIRRLPLLIGLGAAGALVSKLLKRGGGHASAPPAPSAPPAAATPAPASTASTPSTPASPNPAKTAGTGTPPVEEAPDAPAGGPVAPDDADVAPAGAAGAGTGNGDNSPDDAKLKP